jgi:nucleotide-binding universal stress UspA family protein
MSYKSILVEVDNTDTCIERISTAFSLAKQFEAHVTALAFVPPIKLPPSVHTHFGPDVRERFLNIGREQADQALERFRLMAARADISSVETRRAGGDPASAFATHSRYHDLSIIGQFDSSTNQDEWQVGGAFQDEVVLGVGRPVLIVPYTGEFSRCGQKVVVAWDAGREAARAVYDALPLLKRAREVTVLVINAEKSGKHGEEPGADIALVLARHGVRVNVIRDSATRIDAGTFLLSRIADLDADLLVMGAYGHSRLREIVTGGVTRTLLDSMPIPVLMSH